MDRNELIAAVCAASLSATGAAYAADPAASGAAMLQSAPQPASSPALTASLGDNSFLATSAALNAAVRLSNPQGPHLPAYAGPSQDLNTPAPSLNVHYRLLPNAAFSPYIGGSLITSDALQGINRGGVSLNLKNGASVAMGFDTDQTGQAKMKLDVGLQQGISAGPTYDHKTYNPTIVGAGFGLKF